MTDKELKKLTSLKKCPPTYLGENIYQCFQLQKQKLGLEGGQNFPHSSNI